MMIKSKQSIVFWLILLLATILRLWNLGGVPNGINQDEAYTGYEAFSLLSYGMDSWGYRYPIYFTSWASGTSVLYAYLILPFMAIFGADVWVVRLPQAILGVLSCYIFYRLLRLNSRRDIALLGFFISAIVPWHIILSRFGLDANVVAFFVLTGFYFFLRSIKKQEYLLLSALFYGIGLYGYAVSWIFIILTFGFNLAYFLFIKRNKSALMICLIAGGIFLLFAVPLFMLVLINSNVIGEIKTSFFSIPKIVYWRQGEIGFNDFVVKITAFFRVLFIGDDYLITNRIPFYGVLYPISWPFILLGCYGAVKKAIGEIKAGRFSFYFVLMVHVTIGLLYGMLLYPCINRLNFLWFDLIILAVLGIEFIARKRVVMGVILVVYGCFAVGFCYSYFKGYNQMAKDNFTPNLRRALAKAEVFHQQSQLPIKLVELSSSLHPKVLFYQKIDTKDFLYSVLWHNFPAAYLDAKSFGYYQFMPVFDFAHLSPDAVYIAPIAKKYFFYQFNVYEVDDYIVAKPRV